MAAAQKFAAVVTGAGTGVGRALSLDLAKKGFTVVAVGRRSGPLEETAKLGSPEGQIIPLSADVSDPEAGEKILAALPQDCSLRFLIQNAAVLGPVGGIEKLDRGGFEQALAVNVTGPLFITQTLLPKLEAGSRILHVGTGAAHRVLPDWYAYCTSKAAFHMTYRMLAAELKSRKIWVGSMRPGVVDTPMQDQIRSLDFPGVQNFKDFKEKGDLVSPEEVSRFANWLLFDCPEEEFIAEEWDIRDKQHESRWKK